MLLISHDLFLVKQLEFYSVTLVRDSGAVSDLSAAMAYWFHRNPLKATKPVSFEELKKSSKGGKIGPLIV